MNMSQGACAVLRVASIVFSLACLAACSSDKTESVADAGSDPACGALDCGGHGTCHIVAQLPACTCDDGYMVSGLECISVAPTTPEPPAGFTCPAPGAANAPLFAFLTANRWYYSFNDRSCGVPSWRMIYTFRPDGVFLIQSQFQASVGSKSGSLDYGCYTYGLETIDGIEAIRLNYTYSNTSSRNCTMLGSLQDPPCSGALSKLDGEGLVQAESRRDNQEVQVFRPLTDDACVWCSSAANCCPKNSWIADSNGPVCP